jgi:hypothetical protein
MWFLARAADDGTIVLDEPDVYMHPDLQRRLVRFLLARNQQVIVATHSIEMMAEVEPHELVPIDASRRAGRHARDVRDVQKIVDQVGGVHNLEFARLSQARRYFIASRADLRLLKRWEDQLAPGAADAFDLLPWFPFENWDDWPYAIAMKRAIDATRDEPARAICLMAPGLRPDVEIDARRQEAQREGIDIHIWRRRELTNYLINPAAIARAARVETGGTKPTDTEVAGQLEAVMAGTEALVVEGLAPVARAGFARRWETLEGRLAFTPGRLVLLRLAGWLRQGYECSVGTPDVLRAFRAEDVAPEVRAVLEAIRMGSPLSAIRDVGSDRVAWPASAGTTAAAPRGATELNEILGLFEAAGVLDAHHPPSR